MNKALLLCGCFLIAGCGPWVSPVTAPPPAGVAEFRYSDDLIRVSEGVAYAFECSDNGPCNSLAAEVANPQIALAYVAHLTVPQRWSDSMRTVTAFVVVGQRAGRTELLVRNGSDTKKYVVEVLPAVQVSNPASPPAAQPQIPAAPAPLAPQLPAAAPSGSAPLRP